MIKTMLQRLLGHLHRAVFDTTADEVVAFTLDCAKDAKWVAKDEFFDITFADGSPSLHYDLNNFTMSQFIIRLRSDGMLVDDINYDTIYFSGITMLELEGESGSPKPITLYRDILHSIFGAYSREMNQARQNVNDGINQMFIPTADDGFLDQWGSLFGVPRDGDDDPKYRKKIPIEAFRKRVNSIAIEQAVKDLTGYTITIEEPWRDIFRLDESYLSGVEKFYNGQDVGYFIVQPVAYGNVDWNVVMPIIKRNLAAGVITLQPTIRSRFFVNDPLDGTIWFQGWSMYGAWVRTDEMPRLDDGLILSGGYMYQMNFHVAVTTLYSTNTFTSNLLGKIFDSRLNSLIFYAQRGDTPIITNHHGDGQGIFIQLYPTSPRDWKIGRWDANATWRKPYDWSVYSRQWGLQNKFIGNATTIGYEYDSLATDPSDPNVTVTHVPHHPIYSQVNGGDIWSDHDWNDDAWDQGSRPSSYITVFPSNASLANEFVDVLPKGQVTEYIINHPKAGGTLSVTSQRLNDADDKPISGGMATCTMSNSDNTVATVNQAANKYAFTINPVAVGKTVLTISNDVPMDPNDPQTNLVLQAVITINIT